jgi:hypothetical protein
MAMRTVVAAPELREQAKYNEQQKHLEDLGRGQKVLKLKKIAEEKKKESEEKKRMEAERGKGEEEYMRRGEEDMMRGRGEEDEGGVWERHIIEKLWAKTQSGWK